MFYGNGFVSIILRLLGKSLLRNLWCWSNSRQDRILLKLKMDYNAGSREISGICVKEYKDERSYV